MEHRSLIDRGDGRIEIVCACGCGHPAKELSLLVYAYRSRPKKWEKWMDVHGCCGCCTKPEWLDEERRLLNRFGELEAQGFKEVEAILANA